ncbi:hypothetical protein GGX14DRAFT_633281 [Mycena pura]|uniref:Uncharacterized protein n=1 Tax=Mycena pura TaxID=153505 RepID=A0AAD6VFP6_9AGAR|nr:hypothetical protein GGX14DRAFT_633281 [Mycena pura]
MSLPMLRPASTLSSVHGNGTDTAHGVGLRTFVGAAYAEFLSRVGRFILDAALPHAMVRRCYATSCACMQLFQDTVTDQVAAINRLLLRADAFCMTDTACPFHSAGKGGIVKAWTVLARALQVPLPASKCGPGTGCNAPVTATDLPLGASVLFRAAPDFPLFNEAPSEANSRMSLGATSMRRWCGSCVRIRVQNKDKSFAAFRALSANSNASDPAQIWQFVMCNAWPVDVPEPATLLRPTCRLCSLLGFLVFLPRLSLFLGSFPLGALDLSELLGKLEELRLSICE